jgi:hypothetical protein
MPLSAGILQAAGHEIDLLAAHRGAVYHHLVRLVSTYERLPSTPDTETAAGRNQVPGRASDRGQALRDDWPIAGDRQLRVLQGIENGALRLKRSAFAEQDAYLSDGSGVRVLPIWPETSGWSPTTRRASIRARHRRRDRPCP